MIRLITLGEIDLRTADGAAVNSVLQQPRRLALLVYLAVADAAYVRRDTLLNLFWPEKPEADARHDLSQAIHYLRRSLGPGVIHGRGSEGFGIAPGSLSADVSEFLDALKRGDRAEALRVYRGDFLPGFFAGTAPEFEQWLEAFRGYVRRLAADAAWQLAEGDARAHPVSAAAMARRAVELCLGDEAAVRRLLELLHRIGDRAGAFAAYESLRGRLAAEYGAEPSEETLRLMTRLRTSSPPVVRASEIATEYAAPGPSPESPPPTGSTGRPGLLRERPLRTAVSAAITVALVGAFVSLWGLSRGRADGSTIPTVVVEDLRDYSHARTHGDLAGAVTTEVVARLTGLGSLQVRVRDPALRAAGYGPHHLLLRAGLIQSADSLRVTAVLLDGGSRIPIDRSFAVRPVDGSIALVDDVASWLSGFARTAAGAWVRERQWREGHRRGRALDLMRIAVNDRVRGDSLRRVGAVAAALASYRMADSLLANAERIAPDWSEPTSQRAETALHLMWLHLLTVPPDLTGGRARIATGLRHAARAVQKNDPVALEIRAVLRHWLWRTAPSDSSVAAAASLPAIEADLRQTLERDPTRARAWSILATLLHARGAFGEARLAAERAHTADVFLEYVPDVLATVFSTALEARDRASARRCCDQLQQRNAGEGVSAYCELMLLATFGSDGGADVERGWAAIRALPPAVRSSQPWNSRHELLMAVLLARAGAADTAAAMLNRASRTSDPESAQLLAWGLLELGHADSAAAVLERYVAPRPHARSGVLHSERFRELRAHPRIEPLLRPISSARSHSYDLR